LGKISRWKGEIEGEPHGVPKFKGERRAVTEPGFVVGGSYANAAGEYTVLALEGGMVRIRYAGGVEMSLPAQGLWAQWEALVRERAARAAPPSRAGPVAAVVGPPHTGHGGAGARTAARHRSAGAAVPTRGRKATGEAGFHIAAGMLATGCEVLASVAGRDYPAFAQRYRILTGRTLITPHAGLEIHERPTRRLGAELSVRFSARTDPGALFDLGAECAPTLTDQPHGYVIRCPALVERLLKLGFDLGPNSDPAPIRANVPPAHVVDFDRGVALGRALRR
jgi:hypothetical protein